MVRVLITGGGGLLGSHIIECLSILDQRGPDNVGITSPSTVAFLKSEAAASRGGRASAFDFVRVLDLRKNIAEAPSEETKHLMDRVDEWMVGDVTNIDVVRKAVEGVDLVIHAASVVDNGLVDGKLVERVNLHGTRAVIKACIESETVKGLVYTSTLDVVTGHSPEHFDGRNEENTTYSMDLHPELVTMEHAPYPVSKTIAEKEVLASNLARPGFLTAACRPTGIFGERDPTHMSITLRTAREMGSQFVASVSHGNAFQHVYATNCAWVHILAGLALVQGDTRVGGQAFFTTDYTKVEDFTTFFYPFFARYGYRIPKYRIPDRLAYFIGDLGDIVARNFPSLKPSIKLTRFRVSALVTTQWFKTTKAHDLLGYTPLFENAEVFARVAKHYDDKVTRGPYTYPAHAYEEIHEVSNGDYSPTDPYHLQRAKARREGRESLMNHAPFVFREVHLVLLLAIVAACTGAAVAARQQ